MGSDVRLAFRQIVRRPWFAASAIGALAIGLAINVVAFSAVNAFLFKERAGFDVDGAGRIFVDGGTARGEGVSSLEFTRLSSAAAGVLETAVEGRTALAWNQGLHTETVWALLVSSSYFNILETRPLVGRLLITDDAARSPTALVSERFWRDRLQARDLDRLRLTLNGVDVPVVGVLPDSFEGPGGLYAPQIWVPFESRWTFNLPIRLERDEERWLAMTGRLSPGITIPEINARLQNEASAISREWPRTHAHLTARFALMRDRVPEVQGLANVAAAGMAVVALILLLACFNVANLLLARAVERQREIGIRVALGASRWRIVRQQATEGLVLASLAGIVAAVLAFWSQTLIGTFAIPVAVPQRVNVAPDRAVMGFVALMVIVAGILPCVAPAWHSVRVNLLRALSAQAPTGSGGRPTSVRRTLMAVQVAGSTAFLTVAVLFVQSFIWTGRVHPGFETERAIVLTIDPAAQGYEASRARSMIDRLLEQLRAVPGISEVAVATHIPFHVGLRRLTELAETSAPCALGGCPKVATYGVGPGYFRTLNVPIVRGREFDGAGETGIVVNETLAERWFGSAEPVGHVLRLGTSGEPRVVIGVARNTLQRGFGEQPAPALYLPMALDDYETTVTIVAQTIHAAGSLIPPVEAALHLADPNLAPESLMTMETRLQLPRWPMQSASKFFGACGLLALLLATIGLIAVMSHAVSQRTREFGVRLAVGATSRQLMREVVGSGLRVVAPGIALGLIGAAMLAHGVRSALVGVDINSPAAYLAVAALQAAIALLACLPPARHAARVDPLTALRAE